MKVVDYSTFSKLPKGTVYGFYKPSYSNGLYIKEEQLHHYNNDIMNDWFYSSICEPILECEYTDKTMKDLEEKEVSINIDCNIQCRDGMFDYYRQFIIYEKEDINRIINKLKSLL